MVTISPHRILTPLLLLLCLISCKEERVPDRPMLPDSAIIGPNGPEAWSGWDVKDRRGAFDRADYYNTGGDWYISIEDSAFLTGQAVQVYLNRDPTLPNTYSWGLLPGFRINERFLHIEDPMKAYAGWSYVIFIYLHHR